MAKIYEKKCGKCGKIVRYAHRQKPSACPHCGSERFDKPKTEVDLFELQDHYLMSRDDKYLYEMYEILKSYSKSFIYKFLDGKFHFDHETLIQKCHDAAMGIINYYLSKPEFRIDSSFGGYLVHKVREVLYGDAQEDNHDSLNYRMSFHSQSSKGTDGKDVEREDMVFEAIHQEKPKHDTESVINEFMRLINKIVTAAKEIESIPYGIQMLMALYYEISKVPNSFLSDFYSVYGQDMHTKVEASMKEILVYLQDSMVSV